MDRTELTDISNLRRIWFCYSCNPELITKYPLDEKDQPEVVHKYLVRIYNVIAERGYKVLDKEIISQVIESLDLSKSCKESAVNIINLSIDHQGELGTTVDNIDTYYTIEQKWIILRRLFKLGYDVSYYYCDDPVDFEARDRARERLEAASPSDILEHYENELKEMRTDMSVYSSGSVQICDDFEDLPNLDVEDEVIIEGMLDNCTLDSIVGEPKAGKSFFAYQMAYCVQNGIPFLDKQTTQKDVLYIDFELSTRDIRDRCLALEAMYGAGKRFGIISLASTWGGPNISLDSIVEAVKQRKKENPNLGLIIFDCYYRFAEGEENNAEDTMKTLSKLKLLAANMAVVYVHHKNKSNTKTKAINAGSGSGVHGRVVNQQYVLDAKTDGIDVENTGRKYYNDKFACRRDESGYFIFDGASVSEQKDPRKGFPVMNKITREDLEKDYPDVCKAIEELSNDEYGAPFNKLKDKVNYTVPELKKMGFKYSGKNKRDDGIPSGRIYLPNPTNPKV